MSGINMRAITVFAVLFGLIGVLPAAGTETSKCDLVVTDRAFDHTTTLNPNNTPPTQFQPANSLDIRNVVMAHDGATGSTKATMTIGNLSRKIPAGSTSTVWTVQWAAADNTIHFVRAVNDLTDDLVFEWGVQVPPVNLVVTSALPRYEYRGPTAGSFVAGENGTIELTIPAALSAPGTAFKEIYAQSSEGRQVIPNRAATPTRGLSSPSDRAPDGSAFAGPWTTAPCPEEEPPTEP